jgi:hypothetical protein
MSSTFDSPLTIHIKRPIANRKTTITMYPIKELRKLRISLTKSEYMIIELPKIMIYRLANPTIC